ncbi:hypothetical protein F3Y22_tig00111200pilonHSYRG00124 [Hibiscus syriacus]|uniref:Uncharacterized protein n=1 Tax=Hibiscus syriacus TaxID=106335 RepID=A0A6A2YVM2_HIBSY|nr:uncharacterized protein LOC120155667 [Hibiscus syriacus]KAE8683571.1 hypothetical protein F3Y22_tig00111200pilonHSYRG00124 [Hibiscus syriacus]
MGNGYNHRLRERNMHFNHKLTFFPILCSRPSIKDVSLPKWKDKSEPLSPKISCMGQVTRSNRVVVCPASHKFSVTTKNDNGIKYFKLNKLFSGKNLTGTPVTAATTTATSCRREENSVSVNIENMDPPLPVTKRVRKQGEKQDGDTLWERRSRGVVLKNLQLQQIQLNKHQVPITVEK